VGTSSKITRAAFQAAIAESASVFLGFKVDSMGGAAGLSWAELAVMATEYSAMAEYWRKYKMATAGVTANDELYWAYKPAEKPVWYVTAQGYAAAARAIWDRPVKSFRLRR
jgi:hypothetical protein